MNIRKCRPFSECFLRNYILTTRHDSIMCQQVNSGAKSKHMARLIYVRFPIGNPLDHYISASGLALASYSACLMTWIPHPFESGTNDTFKGLQYPLLLRVTDHPSMYSAKMISMPTYVLVSARLLTSKSRTATVGLSPCKSFKIDGYFNESCSRK